MIRIQAGIIEADNQQRYELKGMVVNGVFYPLLAPVELKNGDRISSRIEQSDKVKSKYNFTKG